MDDEPRRYPNIIEEPVIITPVQRLMAQQRYYLEHSPWRAHLMGACWSLVAGTALGSLRGAFLASLVPRPERLQMFMGSTAAVTPMYGKSSLLGRCPARFHTHAMPM